MSVVEPVHSAAFDSIDHDGLVFRHASTDCKPVVLAEIYREDINMAIWQRELSATLKNAVHHFITSNPGFRASMTVTPGSALSSVTDSLGETANSELSENVAELVDMYCCLFELKRVGLRLAVLGGTMCPKFHVDKVPCRLLTTYQGVATEWLPHEVVNREMPGKANNNQAEDQSGLYSDPGDFQQLLAGDVALLKGESWEGNENAGLVHRSPAVSAGERRLLLTLDFSD